jgi:hypothetical protein
MMEAERIKAARARLWRAWVFGGLLWSLIFLCLATALIGAFGVELTSYFGTLALTAAILAGGTYGILLFGALLIHMIKRIARGQPIADNE